MAFLDRFRPVPKWKHADADVRLAGLQELDESESDVLPMLAREDPDPRVRRAALKRLDDPQALGALASQDADERVREEAAAQLVALAIAASDQARGEAAVNALADERHAASVAKGATLESVAIAALARVNDEKLLAGVARHGVALQAAEQALRRVESFEELIGVATKSDHKDVALGALERVADAQPRDRAVLERIAARARQKAVVRRARVLLREIGEPEAPAVEEPAERRAQRVLLLCVRMESLARSSDVDQMPVLLDALDREWTEVASGAEQARFESGRAAVLNALERRRAEDAAQSEQARVDQERAAICAQLEGEVALDDIPNRVEAAQAAWSALPAGGSILDRRFEAACRALQARRERFLEGESRVDRLRELCLEAERAAELADLPAAQDAWRTMNREWQALIHASTGLEAAQASAVAELTARVEQAGARLSARDALVRDEEHRLLRGNLARLEQLAKRADALAGASELTLKQGERVMRDLRAALEHPPAVPSKKDHEDVAALLNAARTKLYPRLQELRDVDSWHRWANVTVQEELCAKAEALLEVESLAEAARSLHELRGRWKEASLVPRERAEALWRRFKTAHDAVRARCEVFFAQQAAERAENLKKKEAICVRVEGLAESTDWIRTADEIKQLQADWQTIGSVPREQASDLWKRFRNACNRFFKRRQEDLARRKGEWAANLARKEALCARVEELTSSSDWDPAFAEVRRLQAEWRTIGAVRKNKSDAVWQRFRQASDAFFERYKRRDQIQMDAQLAELEASLVELEGLIPSGEGSAGEAPSDPPSDPPSDLVSRIRGLRGRWQQSPQIPRAQAEALELRLSTAVSRLVDVWPEAFRGTEFDPESNRRKMEQLCSKVETLAGTGETETRPNESPTAILARQLREALATNTIGGRVDEESRWREAAEEVRKAQAAWKRIGPVSGDVANHLSERFQRACNRFFSQRSRPLSGMSGART